MKSLPLLVCGLVMVYTLPIRRFDCRGYSTIALMDNAPCQKDYRAGAHPSIALTALRNC